MDCIQRYISTDGRDFTSLLRQQPKMPPQMLALEEPQKQIEGQSEVCYKMGGSTKTAPFLSVEIIQAAIHSFHFIYPNTRQHPTM